MVTIDTIDTIVAIDTIDTIVAHGEKNFYFMFANKK